MGNTQTGKIRRKPHESRLRVRAKEKIVIALNDALG